MQKLGQNIRELRHSWGESLLDLSLVLNKNTSTISQWESGKRTPNNEILYQIANHYKVTVDELLNGDFSDLPSKVISLIVIFWSFIPSSFVIILKCSI